MSGSVAGLERALREAGSARCGSTPSRAGATRPTPRSIRSMPLGVVVPRTSTRRRAALGARARGGRARAAARRRHLAVRPDGQRGARRRLHETARTSARARCRSAALRGRARHRARRAQPAAEAARAVLPGRHLDRQPRHDRRHGRQQFLRRALAALRHDARQRARRSTRCSPTARRAHFGAGRRPISPTSPRRPAPERCSPTCCGSARAKPARWRRASRNCCAGSAATISTR